MNLEDRLIYDILTKTAYIENLDGGRTYIGFRQLFDDDALFPNNETVISYSALVMLGGTYNIIFQMTPNSDSYGSVEFKADIELLVDDVVVQSGTYTYFYKNRQYLEFEQTVKPFQKISLRVTEKTYSGGATLFNSSIQGYVEEKKPTYFTLVR